MPRAKKTPDKDPAAEIIPPQSSDNDTAAANSGRATSNAGAYLRMPPLIEHGVGGLRGLVTRPLAALRDMLRGFFGALVNRVTASLLLVAALGVTGFGIWQARHTSLPQFDSFWHSVDATPAADDATIVFDSANEPQAGFAPSGDVGDLQRQLQALDGVYDAPVEAMEAMDTPDTNSPTIDAGADAAAPGSADAPLSKQQAQAGQQAQVEIAALQQKLAALELAMAAQKTGAVDGLAARAALGELLLRLDSGAVYDDLMKNSALAQVLRRSEWTLLMLYADSGVPTRSVLMTRLGLWVTNTNTNSNSRAIESAATAPGFYARLFDWLQTHANGLITVTEAPLATAGGDIELIATALERGLHDEAAWRIGALLRRLEGDGGLAVSRPDRAGLQLLYDDVRAAAELAPMLASLRDDYLAGVRP